jgi:hypothetical protein
MLSLNKRGGYMRITSLSNISFKGDYFPLQILKENQNYVQKLIAEHNNGEIDVDTLKKAVKNYDYSEKSKNYMERKFPPSTVLEDFEDEDKNLRIRIKNRQSDYVHNIDGIVFKKDGSPAEWFATFKQLYQRLSETNKYEIGVKMFQMRHRFSKLKDFIAPEFLLKDGFNNIIEK